MPRPEKWSILVARFPGGSIMPIDMPETTDYFARIMHELKTHPECEVSSFVKVSDTPITMTRNAVVETAKKMKVHFLVMMDNDMYPDMYLGTDPYAEPFLSTSLKFALDRWDTGPHIIGAPYCGPPPWENVYVFQWANYQSDHPNPDYRLEQFTREEAAIKIGMQKVGALPTGLILFDMRVFDILKPPYFYYEWADETASQKVSTEDVTMTRDAGLAGCKLWCLWSAWAGHFKMKCVSRPKIIYTEQVGEQMRQAVLNNCKTADRKLNMGESGGNYIPPKLLENSDAEYETQESIRRQPGDTEFDPGEPWSEENKASPSGD